MNAVLTQIRQRSRAADPEGDGWKSNPIALLRKLRASPLPSLQSSCLTLVATHIDNYNWVLRTRKRLEERFIPLLAGSDLTELSLGSIYPLTDDAMKSLVTCTPNLEILSISNLKNVTFEGFSKMLSGLPHLRELRAGYADFLNVDPERLDSLLAQTKPQLLSLNVRGHVLTDVHRTLSTLLTRLPQLEALDIGWINDVDSSLLALLLPLAPNLVELQVPWCPLINDRALQVIAREMGPRLRGLNIEQCGRITDTGLIQLSPLSQAGISYFSSYAPSHLAPSLQACPNLVYLNLKNQTELSSVALRQIARLTSLRTLNVAGCREFTDQDLSAIVAGCPLLARLSVMGCPSLSNEAVSTLEAILPRLQQVDLCNTRGISVEAKKRLAQVDVTGLSLHDLKW